jgi:hypothetical protein
MFAAIRNTALGAALGLCAGVAVPAQAAYVATLQQVGANVVATGSGSIDITDLTLDHIQIIPIEVAAFAGYLGLGQTGNPGAVYTGVSGPADIGLGGTFIPSTSSGSVVAIQGNASFLVLPENYVSGTALGTSTDTWDSTTLAALGVTDGTYTWTWGTGAHADSFALQIGPAATAPEPASLALFGAGLAGLGLVLRTRPAGAPGTAQARPDLP